LACPSSMFTNSSNLAECDTWGTCEPGHYVTAEGTPKSDRVCSPCPEGETQPEAGYTGWYP